MLYHNIIRVIKSRKMKWTGHVVHMGGIRTAHKTLVRKHEGKRPHGRHRWEDNITMDLRKTGWKDVGWMHLAQVGDQLWPLVNMVMNHGIPLKAGNFLTE